MPSLALRFGVEVASMPDTILHIVVIVSPVKILGAIVEPVAIPVKYHRFTGRCLPVEGQAYGPMKLDSSPPGFLRGDRYL
jgi:hypothetical protein